jgi:uncharacterized protein YegJ (DUF2314 family)
MPHDPLESFSSDDAQMKAAIRTAKGSFGQFLEAYFEPTETQSAFLVKAAMIEGDQVEHIWIADLEITTGGARGVVANQPRLPSLKFMQTIEFELAQITDWMYIDDGYLVGGFTTRVIRDRMTPKERRSHDATAPYKIRDIT